MLSSLLTLLKSGRSFKKQVRRMTKYFCAKYTPSRFLYVSESFLFSPEYGPVLHHKGQNSLFGHFSRKSARINQSKSKPINVFSSGYGSLCLLCSNRVVQLCLFVPGILVMTVL